MKLLAPALFAMSACVSLSARALELGHFDRALTVSGPVDLDAMTSSGGIVITKGAGGTVRVHAILEQNDYLFGLRPSAATIREIENHPPVEQSGNTLRIGYMHDSHLLDGVSMRLEIEVPQDTRVHAHANSGGIHVSDIHGPVECRTNSGGIGLHNIGGDVIASANSGGITALDIAGAIDVQTSSGGVRVLQTKAAPIHARTSSGGATIKLVDGAGYNVRAETGSGGIRTPEMTIRSGYSRHHVEGTVRGGGPEVVVHASSGSVHID
jgi:hypothetical protein